MLGALLVFLVWTVACAVAPNWSAFLVFRFLSGAFGSAPIAIVMGIFADIYDDPVTRGRGTAAFMAVSAPSEFTTDHEHSHRSGS